MYEYYAKVRDEKGLKDSDISRLAHIASSTLSEWKSGKYEPKADKMQRIAEVLNVPVEYLITGEMPEQESVEGNKWYFDDESAQLAQDLYERQDLRLLFSACKDVSPEDLKLVQQLVEKYIRKD